jgi:hypothetical protein
MLDEDLEINARSMVDKHVVKMPEEEFDEYYCGCYGWN